MELWWLNYIEVWSWYRVIKGLNVYIILCNRRPALTNNLLVTMVTHSPGGWHLPTTMTFNGTGRQLPVSLHHPCVFACFVENNFTTVSWAVIRTYSSFIVHTYLWKGLLTPRYISIKAPLVACVCALCTKKSLAHYFGIHIVTIIFIKLNMRKFYILLQVWI